MRSFKLKFKFRYPREGSNTKPNHSEKPSDCPTRGRPPNWAFREMLLSLSSFTIPCRMLACGVRSTNMARRRKLLSVCEESTEHCCVPFGWKTCWRVTELNGTFCCDLGEERHFPVRLVLELMLFVCWQGTVGCLSWVPGLPMFTIHRAGGREWPNALRVLCLECWAPLPWVHELTLFPSVTGHVLDLVENSFV